MNLSETLLIHRVIGLCLISALIIRRRTTKHTVCIVRVRSGVFNQRSTYAADDAGLCVNAKKIHDFQQRWSEETIVKRGSRHGTSQDI